MGTKRPAHFTLHPLITASWSRSGEATITVHIEPCAPLSWGRFFQNRDAALVLDEEDALRLVKALQEGLRK